MLFKKNQGPKTTPQEPVDDVRQEIAMRLRTADRLIREGKYPQAKEELDTIRALDPNNVYALALEERRQGLESGGIEQKQQGNQNVETTPSMEAKEKEEKPQIDEAKIRAEIEKRLEGEYNKKFTDKIREAEQRIADALKKEREWQEAERASLIASLQKEKDKYRKELERQSKESYEIEVEKMEATFRQQLASERKKAEEDTRSEMSSLYEKSMLELRESAIKEKQNLLEKQRKAIDESKKQMEAEFQQRMTEETTRVKASAIAEQAKERDKAIDEARHRLEEEFDGKWMAEERKIEEQIKSQQNKLEQSYQERHETLEQKSKAELEGKLNEIRNNEQTELQRKQTEIRNQLEKEFQAKLDAKLAAEREEIERRVEEEISNRQASLEADRRKLVEEEQRQLNETRAALKAEMQKKLEQDIADAKSTLESGYERRLELLGVKLPDTLDEKIDIYSARLRKAWSHLPITTEVARDLMQLRELLALSFEDHQNCETEVRLQLYTAEVEKEIKNGKIRPNEGKVLEELKLKYQITKEEASKLEPHILAAFQRAVLKAVILLVDDDHEFLDTVKTVLEGYGYGVLTSTSPTEAMKTLTTTNVDMIISDVMFSETEGDGFSFYEGVQKIPRLRKVPFILISGMHESFFVKSGIQLGVDDYLTKPVDPEMLAAVVEGKLKKYRSLLGEE